MKTLLVDDNADDRRFLRYLFERHGYEVVEAADGKEGIEKARSYLPDIIISDALMPEMDGFLFLRRIKEDDALRVTPFIFFSAIYTGSEDRRLGLSLGADAFIAKPQDPDSFWAVIEDVLKKRSAGGVPGKQGMKESEYIERYCSVVTAKLVEKVSELEREISLRECAEDELRKSEARYRALFETSPDAIVVLDLDLRVTDANQAALRMFGYEGLDEVEKKGILDFVVPEEKTKAKEELQLFLLKGYAQDLEFTVVRRDGTGFPVWLKASLLRDAGGRPHSIMKVIRDLSERRLLEEQLVQAQKMESLGTLAGGVAHDFNNMMSAVLGFADILKRELDKESPSIPYVDDIIEAAGKASRIAQQLLLFSRRQKFELRLLDLNECIRREEKLLRSLLPANVGLEVIPSEAELRIMADSSQVEQVLLNLATNARDAMPEGGSLIIATDSVKIDAPFIRAHGYGEEGRYALLTVTDTGSGMDEATRKRIFEPFFTTKGEEKGTGLGLSVVYGIVKGHRGFIDLSSEPGLGSTFSIYLPLAGSGGEASGR